jgi:hypothetical protein
MKSRRVTVALAVAAVVGGGGAAAAIVSAQGAGEQPAVSDPPPLREATPRTYPQTALGQELVGMLGVLRRADAGDQLPDGVQKIASNVGGIPSAARLAARTSRGPLYVVPGVNNKVCVLDEYGAGSCNYADVVAKGGLFVTQDHVPGQPDDQTRVFGVVPDGIARVSVTGPGNAAQTVPVSNNVFEGSVAAAADKVSVDVGP